MYISNFEVQCRKYMLFIHHNYCILELLCLSLTFSIVFNIIATSAVPELKKTRLRDRDITFVMKYEILSVTLRTQWNCVAASSSGNHGIQKCL